MRGRELKLKLAIRSVATVLSPLMRGRELKQKSPVTKALEELVAPYAGA